MQSVTRFLAALAAVLVWLPAEAGASATMVEVEPLERLAARAGLRVISGRHMVLATDRPVRDGDGVEDLPAILDQAFDAWCRHYGMEPAAHAAWRCFGCLVVDRERFRAAGLLPDSVPKFENGFCDRNRFWLADQSNPAYRRHLLLHEAAHAFTLTLRDLATPVWYNEGIAEYLATHRLDVSPAGGVRFAHTPVPDRPADVEQLGRIETIRELRRAGGVPSLADVLALPSGAHGSIGDYATSWAAVALFAGHPSHAEAFAALERDSLGPDFNRRLASLPGWDAARAAADFDAFTADIDYGWDFGRMAVDWKDGPPLTGPRRVVVAADRGWQNAGFTLAAGRRYAFIAQGRVGLGTVSDAATGLVTRLESEAEGISLSWYRGRPDGRLLVGQWLAMPARGRPRFETLAAGAAGEFEAVADGPLQLRLNGPPGRLAGREGTLTVTVRPTATD